MKNQQGPTGTKQVENKKRASMPDPIVCGRLLGRPQVSRCQECGYRNADANTNDRKEMVVWRPWFVVASDYGRIMW